MGKDLQGETFTFSWFSRVLRKLFLEYKCLSLFILHNEYLWPRQYKNIFAKTLMVLKPQIFRPVNLSLSMVWNSSEITKLKILNLKCFSSVNIFVP